MQHCKPSNFLNDIFALKLFLNYNPLNIKDMAVETKQITPISTQRQFIDNVLKYISDNDQTVPTLEATPEDFSKQPSLGNCSLFVTGDCPDQSNNYQRCHKCPYSKSSLEKIEHYAKRKGFISGGIESYEAMVILHLDLEIQTSTGKNTLQIEVDGNEKGMITTTLLPVRK
jgi:hypothetical protein